MSSADSRPAQDEAAKAVLQAGEKGVRLWLDGVRLRFTGPKGALSQEEINRLRSFRDQIIALLQSTDGVNGGKGRRRGPLAFSQLAHWNFYDLQRRPAIRQSSFAVKLSGGLDIEALRQSLVEIVHRHDALRTRVVLSGDVPMMEVCESCECQLEVTQVVSTTEAERELETKGLIEEMILRPVDPSRDALFAVKLLKIHDTEHVMVVALVHTIADAVSLNIFFRDLFTAYRLVKSGAPVSWSDTPLQFLDYALWQRGHAQAAIETHGRYWNERLLGCERLRFPAESIPDDLTPGWEGIKIRIAKEVKTALRSWCRAKRTSLVMGVFTAYVATVLRWCGVSEGVIQYQWDGRLNDKERSTIGYFASSLYVRVNLTEGDTFADLMDKVTREYCIAYEHAPFGYIEAQLPRPGIACGPAFNWIPQGSDTMANSVGSPEEVLTCQAVDFEHPMLKSFDLDHEPMTVLHESDTEVEIHVRFPRRRYSTASMERFARNLSRLVMGLLEESPMPVRDIPLE